MRRVRAFSGLIALVAGLAGVSALTWNGLSSRTAARRQGPGPIGCPPAPGAVDETTELRPGLLAEYRSLAGDDPAAIVRIDDKPAFTWGHSSPHPRLPPGPFAATWSGVLILRESHVRFGAHVAGEVDVTVNDVAVLHGRGHKASTWVEAGEPLSAPPGLYRIRIRYRSLPGVPARLQLWWEGPSFAREPLPATRLKHVPAELPDAARQEERAARGAEAVARLGCARCHAEAFPGVDAPPPGPALAELGSRVKRAWLLAWLGNPAGVRAGARMPALFDEGARGRAERLLVADYLLGSAPTSKDGGAKGDHRAGKRLFYGLGCVACHEPRLEPEDADKPIRPADPERYPAWPTA